MNWPTNSTTPEPGRQIEDRWHQPSSGWKPPRTWSWTPPYDKRASSPQQQRPTNSMGSGRVTSTATLRPCAVAESNQCTPAAWPSSKPCRRTERTNPKRVFQRSSSSSRAMPRTRTLSPQELQIATSAADWLQQPPDRQAHVPLAPDRRVPPLPDLPQARGQHPQPTAPGASQHPVDQPHLSRGSGRTREPMQSTD